MPSGHPNKHDDAQTSPNPLRVDPLAQVISFDVYARERMWGRVVLHVVGKQTFVRLEDGK